MTATTADAPPPELRLPKRRGVELVLLMGAVLISVYGYINVGLAKNDAVPADTLNYGAGLGLLALLAHLAVRFRAPYADPLLLPIAVLLNGIGLVLIYRLDLETPGDSAAPTQLIWSTLAVALFICCVLFLRDHRVLQHYTYLSVAAALALMIIPILFPAVNGAKIWIRVGGFSIQPGEFAKILLAVFFAAYLSANRNALSYTGRRIWRLQLPTMRVLAPVLAIWLISVGVLVLERDLGTSLLFFGLFVIMLYVATGLLQLDRDRHGDGGVRRVRRGQSRTPYPRPRRGLAAPLRLHRSGPGCQPARPVALRVRGGGILGTGLGLGHSILIGFAVKSDFILATAGEELGLAGLSAIFLLYALAVARGYRAGLALRDTFGRLLAIGLSSILAIQVFVIAGGVMGLIPLTGMAMPFLAQGGSSLVTNWVIVALLIRISDSARRPDPEFMETGIIAPIVEGES